MIRRNPTRIELKLDDLNEFEVIQNKKKASPICGPEAQKLLRQERIGCPPSSGTATLRLPQYRRVEPLPTTSVVTATATATIPQMTTATPPNPGVVPSHGGTTATSALVVQTPSSFDEFGIGIVADSSPSNVSTSSTSSLQTPTYNNNGAEQAAGANSSNNITTSSMELSLDYLND